MECQLVHMSRGGVFSGGWMNVGVRGKLIIGCVKSGAWVEYGGWNAR